MSALAVPSAPATPLPTTSLTKFQHWPVQLTRLPTTLAHCTTYGWPALRPPALSVVFERIGPLVAVTAFGCSTDGFGAPLSAVMRNARRWPSVHGTGDCCMLR